MMRRTHLLSMSGLALALVSACAGCRPVGHGAEAAHAVDEAAQRGHAPPLPAIHAVLHWEAFGAGKNQARDDYHARLEACAAAGYATTPLAPSDVERLDTGRIEISMDARRQSVRQTQWTLGFDDADPSVEGSCRFRLDEDVDQTVPDDAQDLYLHASDPADTKMLAAAGGWVELGSSSVAGQQCRRWRRTGGDHGPDEETCIWSGGAPWGFGGEPKSLLGCQVVPAASYLTTIPLETTALQGEGCTLRVESFSVGTAGAAGRGGNH